MSMADTRIHRRIAHIVAIANDFLSNDYVLGYRVPHTHHDRSEAPQPDGEIIRSCNEGLAAERRRLGRLATRGHSWATDDLAALPDDAATIGDCVVFFRMLHKPSGAMVIRTYSLTTIRNLVTNDALTTEQKRQVVRTELQSFYTELQARIL